MPLVLLRFECKHPTSHIFSLADVEAEDIEQERGRGGDSRD